MVVVVFPKLFKPQVESWKINPQHDISNSSDKNAEVDDSDNIDLFECNDTPRPFHQFQFIGTTDVKVEPADITSHLECLKLFLSDNVASSIVEYTNSHTETMQNLPEIRKCMD